ncbi:MULTISPECIES: monovalent cation/H(+) antiporter subunit G [unclassified Devosia]|jgi:multicomponent K+:H+ antiporter subunit G|uniref:monovalent cation/H(+) antiporter subunit G n=1 Tax=unclassified Devosia TaxID=196773 RepID=UPI001554543B|nr:MULTISPECIES: monovalent cation/H(+) antiporter subunit G [unclassified Devosia]
MSEIPVWLAVLVGGLSILGAAFTLLGCIGLARFDSFYARIHAPTLGTSLGSIAILLASIVYFTVSAQRPAVHEVLILVFVSITTPVTLMLLARAALYRDRAERSGDVPPQWGQDIVVERTDAPTEG